MSDARILDRGYRRYDGPRLGVGATVRSLRDGGVLTPVVMLCDSVADPSHAAYYRAALTNFRARLPAPHSDLARESLKDPYRLDFLGLGEDAQERVVEAAGVHRPLVIRKL